MKKYSIILVFSFLSASLFCQRPDKRAELNTLKIGFLTKQLELTSTEAQAFWPIYNEFDSKMFALRQQRFQKNRSLDINNLTDQEALELIQNMRAAEEKKYKYESQLIDDLIQILPPKKIIILKKSEMEFSRKVLEQYKQKRKAMRPQSPE